MSTELKKAPGSSLLNHA